MKSLAHLNKYFWKYKWQLVFGIIFVVTQNFFAVYPAQIVRKSLDTVVTSLQHINEDVDSSFVAEITNQIFIFLLIFKLFTFLLIIIAVALLRGFLMFMMRQTLIVMSRYIEYDLKNEIYEQYQRLTLAFYRRNNTG